MLYIYLSMIDGQEDKDKFTEIYNKYKSMMHRVAYLVLKNKQDAEDAVHDAFLKLSKNFHKVEGYSCKKIESFLVILSRNASIDMLRRNHREQGKIDISEDNDMDSLESSATSDILGEVVSKEGYNRLVKLINELSDTYRDTIALRFIFEWSNEEIAEFLGISRNTVEVRINRGRAKLIAMLEKEKLYADRK